MTFRTEFRPGVAAEPPAATRGFVANPGRMKNVAVLRDPDGDWIETREPAHLTTLGSP